MGATPTHEELAAALTAAGGAHHDYESRFLEGRRDEQWPGWYAAYVLGRIGDKSNATTLILVAAESDQHRYAQVYLEAAHNLDPERAVKEAFRFFHLRATTLRHQATKFVRSHIHKENLPQVIELLDRKHAPLSVTREIGLQLLDRMYFVGEVDWATISEHIYKLLGDTSPQVAKRAMLLCAARRAVCDNCGAEGLVAGLKMDRRKEPEQG